MIEALSINGFATKTFTPVIQVFDCVVQMTFQPIYILPLLLMLSATSGCSSARSVTTGADVCSDEWEIEIEERLQTGDGEGHGPDIGSDEWKAVVEFKLGIRDNKEVPQRESDDWCQYIQSVLE